MSLAKKTANAMAWVTLITIITKIIGFVTQIVLAKLLSPADFGLLAIGLLAINSMGIFRDLGFGATLIYKKDDSDRTAANTAFILLPLVASTLFLIAYFSAPYIALFFDNMAVEPIVQVLALTFFISSFGTVPSMLLEKELEFKKKVVPETVPMIGYAFVAIWLAMNGYGVWSLVYGQIVSAMLTAGLVWLVFDWRPTFKFDRKVARVLFDYGKHIMGASLIIFLVTNVDDAIVGRVLGMEALGFYTLAYTISNLPATQITNLVGRVMFPLYSKLQDDQNALKSAYLKTFQYVTMLSIPAAFGIFVIAPNFVEIVLGDKWIPSVVPMQILCIFGLIRSVVAPMGNVFQAVGKPQILVKTSISNLLFILLFIYPLTNFYGIIGTSMSVSFAAFTAMIYCFYKVIHLLNLNLTDIILIILKPFAASIVMIITVYFAIMLIYPMSALTLIGLVVIGFFSYSASIYLISKNILIELINDLH